eukprot:360184-Chlamydomonas_euryale.AAC.4
MQQAYHRHATTQAAVKLPTWAMPCPRFLPTRARQRGHGNVTGRQTSPLTMQNVWAWECEHAKFVGTPMSAHKCECHCAGCLWSASNVFVVCIKRVCGLHQTCLNQPLRINWGFCPAGQVGNTNMLHPSDMLRETTLGAESLRGSLGFQQDRRTLFLPRGCTQREALAHQL